MPVGYNNTPVESGGFNPVHSSSYGYVNKFQNLPASIGRSKVRDIPEYARNPFLLASDMVSRIEEGRQNMMKVLYEYAAKNGVITRPDVKFRFPIEIVPHGRFYIKAGTYTTTSNIVTFSLNDVSPKPYSIPNGSKGNSNDVGEIAKIEAGQFLMLMFSFTNVGRSAAPLIGELASRPLPELCKVLSVDYAKNKITVERNWAGSQRTTAVAATQAIKVVANTSADSLVYPTSGKEDTIREMDAFFLLMPRAMKEDEIDAKVFSTKKTWGWGTMQRTLRAWGAGHLQEVLNINLGNGSQYAKNKKEAIDQYWKEIELSSIFGEEAEGWDPETGDWWGMTNGLLAKIPASHYVGIKPLDWSKVGTSSQDWGTFHPQIFNKFLSNKAYFGSQTKVLLCGEDFHSMFSTMINSMTQNIPNIVSEWHVSGKRFSNSNGLTIDVVPSDTFSLNGFQKKAILFDPSAFRLINLAGYPTDIIELNNENPLKKNGFIHGVHGFFDFNPDAHWVFTLDSTADVLGTPLEK